MGALLDEILSEVKESITDEQVRIICDKIMEEEKNEFKYPDEVLKGPNIFLCLEIPGRNKKEIGFLVLEREAVESYIVGRWVRFKPKKEAKNPEKDPDKKPPLKRVDAWPIKYDTPKKIIKEYAEKLKYVRGE